MSKKNELDSKFMLRAISLAKNGEGAVNPNPLVGAVIVKDKKIIGEGYHVYYGGPHAEKNAIFSLVESAEGADLYVTLEPCNHAGKTPPCTEAIIQNKIKRVIIGSYDPNPLVDGKGIQRLKESGIEVVTEYLKDKCDSLNDIYFHYIKTGIPYVLLKYAMTLDGKIATKADQSKWITNESSREYVQRLRNKYSSIMVGINTVALDDPLLTCRIKGLKSPVRVICDSELKISLESNIVKTAKEYSTIVACAKINEEKKVLLEEKGVSVVCFNKDDKVDLSALLSYLGTKGIDSVLVEGGGILSESMIKLGLVDEINAFIAPKVFGGIAKTPVTGEGISEIDHAYTYNTVDVKRFGSDIMITCKKIS